MPANTSPIFTLTPNAIPVHIAAANLASDGSGSLVTLVTAGANGTLVPFVTFRNAQTTQAASSAMLVKIWVSDAAGANFRIVGEQLMPAATRSASVLGATITHTFPVPYPLKSGQIMSVSQSIYASAADQNSAFAPAGDF